MAPDGRLRGLIGAGFWSFGCHAANTPGFTLLASSAIITGHDSGSALAGAIDLRCVAGDVKEVRPALRTLPKARQVTRGEELP